MRITVLTLRGSLYGLGLLNDLKARGIDVAQVIVFQGTLQRNIRLVRGAYRRIGLVETARYIVKHVLAKSPATPPVSDYRQLASRVDFADRPKAPETLSAMETGKPDVCLLGQSGIIPGEVLAIPRHATLNAHPGVLPEYRGVDACYWAIHEGRFDKVGATLHVVDAGVDTGRILESRTHSWRGDETVDNLEHRLYDCCREMLVEACTWEWPACLAKATAQGTGGKYYHLMPPSMMGGVRSGLKNYLAGRRRVTDK